ncbi:ABC transporter substrate-binding protein [Rhodococcus qingshengii]|uniref:ABC transporter substrate-binding protein n=1 Tax=Rhodococcus qingshengii TaxID=334542 RepID=UPI0027A3B43B|nr:ABC transporter substrate-binding protein [Rhodococcus qingshengii]
MKITKTVHGLTALFAVALAASACGSSGGNAGVTPGSVPLPEGDPIVFYDITDATGLGSVSAAISQFTIGEKAAQDYLNAAGGVDGRPVLIKTCDSKADPAATTACAQKAIEEGAVAKLGLSVAWGENGFPVLKRAGIPSLNPPVNPQDMRDGEGSFVTAGAGEYEAQVQYAAEVMKAKSLVVFTDENPSGQDQVNRVNAAVRNYGYDMSVQEVFLPSGTTDPTPFVAKAVQGKPDAIMTNQSGAQAVSAYTAFAQQGYPASQILNQGGAADFESFFDKVDNKVANGTLFAYAFENPDETTNADVMAYREAMMKYAGVEGKSEFYEWGFANVITLANIAKEIGVNKFDAPSLKQFLLTVEDFPMFLGQPMSRSYATAEAPAMIRPQIQIMQYQDGALKTVKPWFNPYEGAGSK